LLVRFGVVFAALAVVALISVGCDGARALAMSGAVVRVADGDTVTVDLSGGGRERVRVLGIDTPELGECGGTSARAATRALALAKRVSLATDATQGERDRFGRLLAYVELPGGRDLGNELLRRGLARVYVYDRPFERLDAYRRAEAAGRAKTRC
jgi:micrococcal nuclease